MKVNTRKKIQTVVTKQTVMTRTFTFTEAEAKLVRDVLGALGAQKAAEVILAGRNLSALNKEDATRASAKLVTELEKVLLYT